LVFTSTNLQESEIIRAMLEGNGITAVSINKKDSSYAFGEIEIYVNQEDFLKAKHLITNLKA